MKDLLGLLVRMLDDETSAKRAAAAIVLAEAAPEEENVLEALRRAADRDDDPTLRRWVVEAIGAIGPRSIVKDLQPLLRDRDKQVRAAVKNVLATSKGVRESEIATMLDEGDERDQLAAIGVLGAMGTSRSRKSLIDHLRGTTGKTQGAIIDALRPQLAEDEKAAKQVIVELENAVDADAVSKDPDYALAAVQLLGNTKNDAAAPLLTRIAATAGAEDSVRVSALETLQRMVRGRHAKLFARLVDLVEDNTVPRPVRTAAIHALANLEVPRELESRVRALAKADSAPERRFALTALAVLDTAPAAETLAEVIAEGSPDDRTLALESAVKTPRGRSALGRLLGRLTDPERAAQVAQVLRQHPDALTPETKHALERAVMEAPPDIGQLVLSVLKQTGSAKELRTDLFEKAIVAKNKRKFEDAIGLLRSLTRGQDDPEALFHLGVCEVKISKRKLMSGPNPDACLNTFADLAKHRDFPLLEQLSAEKVLDPEDLYYLGFSLAERTGAEQGLGGDILVHLVETSSDAKLAERAKNKLKTLGWAE